VLNKAVAIESECQWISDEFGADSLLGVIPFDSRIGLADRLGQSLIDLGQEDLLSPFRKLKDTLASRTKEVLQ
jgi:hypothetical protein